MLMCGLLALRNQGEAGDEKGSVHGSLVSPPLLFQLPPAKNAVMFRLDIQNCVAPVCWDGAMSLADKSLHILSGSSASSRSCGFGSAYAELVAHSDWDSVAEVDFDELGASDYVVAFESV